MSRSDQVGSTHTVVGTDTDGYQYVQYHDTKVIRWNTNFIELRHGGYKTNTTKARINQAGVQYRLKVAVFCQNKQWFVDCDGITLPWQDTDEVFHIQRRP